MARVDVPVTTISRTGTADATPVAGDPVENHSVTNDGYTWVEVDNTAGTGSHTLTAHIAATPDGQTVDPRTWTLTMGARLRIGPFPTRLYGPTLLLDVDDAELTLTAYRVAIQS